jgi:large repetitive protein
MRHNQLLLIGVAVGLVGLSLVASGKARDDGPEKRVLIVGGIDNTINAAGNHPGLASSELYEERTQLFVSTGPMSEGRTGHQPTLLRDGYVLVTGGDGAETDHPVASAELYDPHAGAFSPTESMEVARVGHTAVLLKTGRVLVAGGQDSTFTNLSTAELFDPASGTFSPTANMNDARTGHTATLLDCGKVLLAGGENAIGLLSSAELYDPAAGTFSPTGNLSVPRLFATATFLDTGKVLIAGGGSLVDDCSGCSVASAEIYDPGSGEFSAVSSMGFARRGHVAVLLKNHNVLLAGGIDDGLPDPERFLSSAELFDVRNLNFSPTSSMISPRFDHAASLLRDGNVLITGGFIGATAITDTAELFDPLKGSFVTTGTMTDARAEHTSTGLPRR